MKKLYNEYIAPLIFPLLFCFMQNLAVLEIYDFGGFSKFSVIAFLACAMIFVLLEFMRRHKVIGSVLYIIVMYLAIQLLIMLISGHRGFSEWMLSGGEEHYHINFVYALILCFSVFFCSAGYYFTVVLHRITYTTLICLIPCVLYVKVRDNITSGFLIALLLTNFIILLMHRQKLSEGSIKVYGRGAKTISIVFICAVTLLVSAVIPRSNNTAYYSTFQRLFLEERSLHTVSDKYSRTSGNADYYRYMQNENLYYVQADEIMYLARQSFETYNNEYHVWECENFDDVMSLQQYTKTTALLSYDKLLSAFREAQSIDESFASRHDLEKFLGYSGERFDTINTITLTPLFKNHVYILYPARLYDYYADNKGYVKVIENDGLFLSRGENKEYTMQYYEEVFSAEKFRLAGGADMSLSDYYSALTDARGILSESENEESLLTIKAFITDYENAMNSVYDYEIPQKIKDLALQITEGCKYDYQKAEALQRYFRESGFKYDLDYYAPTDSIEYFLFKSKTGTCSDFATAFTLMAKASGLTVRYMEGFVTEINTLNDYPYIITTRTSHAYPQVFISGLGWVVYEPTMVVYRDAEALINESEDDNPFENITVDIGVIKATAAVAAGIIILILLIKLYPAIEESLFAIRAKRYTPQKCIISVYNRIRKTATKQNSECLAPKDVISYCDSIGFDITSLVDDFERVCYGMKNADDERKQNAIDTYKAYKQHKKQMKKKKRQK